MRRTNAAPRFGVVSGAVVHEILSGRDLDVIDLVENAYSLHGAGETVNPPSYFLRFPGNPAARIIALPAAVHGDIGIAGIKWISSYPANLDRGLPRASAALILNDAETGYPFGCLEGSIISATRTAASAAVAVRHLLADHAAPVSVGFIGSGLIARYLHRYLAALGLAISRIGVHDLSREYAVAFAAYAGRNSSQAEIEIFDTAESLIRSHGIVIFATIADTPYIADPGWFDHQPLVLHISLRDLGPQVIIGSYNITDDIEHVLQAGTSLHLAAQQTGRRDFINGTLCEIVRGKLAPPRDRTVIFSPFGLGVLDLVVADFVFRHAAAAGRVTFVDDFFFDLDRHRAPDEPGGPG
jgi:2,3-diaminopropionate biosynthesis protein SbnB